ncbi:MAG: DUF2062 domain-containing protein [Pseudomonadota bacterium]
MVFKRRDKKPFLRGVLEFLWPRGGYTRAFHYVKHRVRRLPDSPERIARGIWAGVFTTFTPLYGLHFVVAALIAWIMRGNILAALMATFFGNPFTYVPIGVASLQTGYALLGRKGEPDAQLGIWDQFKLAFEDLWHNLLTPFTGEVAHWSYLIEFYDRVFFPYLIGGLIPGIIVATIAYYLSAPLIRAYQTRRKGALKAKFEALKAKASGKPGTQD